MKLSLDAPDATLRTVRGDANISAMDSPAFRRIRHRIFERLTRIVWCWVPPEESDWVWVDAVRNRHPLGGWGYAMVTEAFRRRDRHLVALGRPVEGWLPYTFVNDVLPYQAGCVIYKGLKPEQRQQLLAVLFPHTVEYWLHAPPHAKALIVTRDARMRMAANSGQRPQGKAWKPQHIEVEAGAPRGRAGMTTDANGNVIWRGPHY